MSCVSFMWRHKKRTFDEDLSKYHRENERRGSGEAAVIYFRGMVKECIFKGEFGYLGPEGREISWLGLTKEGVVKKGLA